MKDMNDFEKTLELVYKTQAQNGIGTLSEKTLHSFLKHFIEPNTDYHEIKVFNKVCDIYDGQVIIEIQTRQFFKLKSKLDLFLEEYKVKIVYPIPYIKHLSWIDLDTGVVSKARKSPKTGRAIDSITELYSIKQYLDHPNLSIHLIFFNLLETRYLNGWSHDKKKGSHRADRQPTEYVKTIELKNVEDFDCLLEGIITEPITSKSLSKDLKISQRKAQLTLNVLNHLNRLEEIESNGRLKQYKSRNM